MLLSNGDFLSWDLIDDLRGGYYIIEDRIFVRVLRSHDMASVHKQQIFVNHIRVVGTHLMILVTIGQWIITKYKFYSFHQQ